MAKWQRKLDLTDVWEKANDEEITVSELSATIADRLEALSSFGIKHDHVDLEKVEIIEEFRILAEDECVDFDEFNFIFRRLYDWADQSLDDKFSGKKVCWVATNF